MTAKTPIEMARLGFPNFPRFVRIRLAVIFWASLALYALIQFYLVHVPCPVTWRDTPAMTDLVRGLCLTYVGSYVFYWIGDQRLRQHEERRVACIRRELIERLEFSFDTSIHSMLNLGHFDNNSVRYMPMATKQWDEIIAALKESKEEGRSFNYAFDRLKKDNEEILAVYSHDLHHFDTLFRRLVFQTRSTLNMWIPPEVEHLAKVELLSSYRWSITRLSEYKKL